MRVAPVGQRDAVDRREVILVVVERGDRGRAPARRSARGPRPSAPARAGWRPASGRAARRTDPRPRRRRRRGRGRAAARDRAVAPAVAPRDDGVGLADPDDLAHVEHLQPGRVARRLVAEHVDAARRRSSCRRRAAARARRSRGRPGSTRPARATRSLMRWYSLQSSWRDASSNCSQRLALAALEPEDRAGEVREVLEVAQLFSSW